MLRRKALSVIIGSLAVALFGAGSGALLLAQEEGARGANAPTATFENGQAPTALPIKHSGNLKLTEQQERGAGVFFQRCALCHLPKTNSKACCAPSLGPNLAADFKNVTPAKEKALREIILNGGPTYMPGWKYALEPKEVDDIIAYLKTLE